MGRREHSNQTKALLVKNKHNLIARKQNLNENIDKLLKLSTSICPQLTIDNQTELHDVIETIKSLESNQNDNGDYIRESQDRIAVFYKWLSDNGAIFEGCSIDSFPGYDLGLKAEKDFKFGSLVLAVPKKLMITVENAKKSILGSLIERDHILKNMPNVVLALYLLVEKFKDDSFYKPYLDVLPRNYSTVLYFNKTELKKLKGSPSLEIALKQIRSISRQYSYFHTIFAKLDNKLGRLLKTRFTFQEYCWAVSTVMTRQNTIPSEDGTSQLTALIPLWDFCNHAEGRISTDYSPIAERSECFAFRDFASGEQILIFYGARTNLEFFIHNGFVPEKNEFNSYLLKLGLSKSDPLREKRSKLLKRMSMESCEAFHLKNKVEINSKLLGFIRIFNMSEDQLNHHLENEKSLEYYESDLEKKSLLYLQTRLKLLSCSYGNDLNEDSALLEIDDVSPNTKLAAKLRKSEKEIISNYIQHLEEQIKQI